jgi:DNA-directed RNA polymerase specialized sigma24 family protein
MDAMADGLSLEADQAGFTDFFRAEYETLLRAMYLLTGDRHEAEDLAQDAFVKACERWDRKAGQGTETDASPEGRGERSGSSRSVESHQTLDGSSSPDV